MNTLLGFLVLLFLSLSSIALAHEKFDSHLLPRPLILEFPETQDQELNEDVLLKCTSWRFAGEANDLNPWKRIPSECFDYVKSYMTGKGYSFDLEMVSKQAEIYAKSVKLDVDEKDIWVFDIDETLLSNLPYYADHAYGSEVFDSKKFDKWVEEAAAPAIDSSLKLYNELLRLGFKIFLLTGRSERHRNVTVENLKRAGYHNWGKLFLRAAEDHGKTATVFKSEKRSEMVKEGYRILGNSGDQWSDLVGTNISQRSFKLPNPMYYIS